MGLNCVRILNKYWDSTITIHQFLAAFEAIHSVSSRSGSQVDFWDKLQPVPERLG